MAQIKGSKDKNLLVRPLTSELTTEERMQLVANLIADRIMYDEQNGRKLLKSLSQRQTCLMI
jgi:hypothetical protein